MTIVQSILSFAVSEELVEYNAAAGMTKPRYERAREPHIFLPPEVEPSRAKLGLRDRALVSVLAYSGPRPEEVVCRLAWDDVGEHAIRYVDTKRHRTRHTPLLKPLADDLREWFLASGGPPASARSSLLTTPASGTRVTGATGAAARGKASRSARAAIARTRTLQGPAQRHPGHARGTCGRAT
jgi:integrase